MKHSVLIVDDEYLIRQGVEFMIDWEKEGFTIIGKAANGREALELAQSRHPDLVISDIVMPEMDGMELTSRLQEICPDTQVIILSSYSEFDYVRNTLTHGAADYILKPARLPPRFWNRCKNQGTAFPAGPRHCGCSHCTQQNSGRV
ncbi:response regulator [uncultured Faecalibaculum sp.]|uniref:response regulator n=1 Tax=uncultured Faecalibaculum sp. TaxID=1729681 RepID=UPI00262B9F57|nr:response regulator [uncultured Faecalibaculum sp.]